MSATKSSSQPARDAAEEIVQRVYGGDKDECGELEAVIAGIISKHSPAAATPVGPSDELRRVFSAFHLGSPGHIHSFDECMAEPCPSARRLFTVPVVATGADEGDAEKRARQIVDDFRYGYPPVRSLRFLEWEPLVVAIAAALRTPVEGEER